MNTKKLFCAALILGLSNQMTTCEGEIETPSLISRFASSCAKKTEATTLFLGAPLVWGVSKVITLNNNGKLVVAGIGALAVISAAGLVIKKTLEQIVSDDELDLEERV